MRKTVEINDITINFKTEKDSHFDGVNPFTESNSSPSQSRARVKRPSRVKKDESEENSQSYRVRTSE
jgi:hypothetical protein